MDSWVTEGGLCWDYSALQSHVYKDLCSHISCTQLTRSHSHIFLQVMSPTIASYCAPFAGKINLHGGNQDHHFSTFRSTTTTSEFFNHFSTKCKASFLKLYKHEAKTSMELDLTPLLSISAYKCALNSALNSCYIIMISNY